MPARPFRTHLMGADDMQALCSVQTDRSLSRDAFAVPLPVLRETELDKDRTVILPPFSDADVRYPRVAPGDVIETTTPDGATLVYLLIQRRGTRYVTYRLDSHEPKRYDYFEDNAALASLCAELETVIHHDPFSLRTADTSSPRESGPSEESLS